MGEGYWVWIIPLSSGATSIGIVVDPDYHPIVSIRTFDMALDWLKKFEPQCAAEVEKNLDKVLDFKVLANFSNDCEWVYSQDRVLITGVAGPFLDPFYSPGSDFIALGNTFITDIISRDFADEDVSAISEFYNHTFLDVFRGALSIYDHQYPIWGNPQVMTCKLTWDYSYYWGVFALLFFNEKFTDFGFLFGAAERIGEIQMLSANMQKFFRDWDRALNTRDEGFYVDQFDIDYLYELHKGINQISPNEELAVRLDANVARCEQVARWMVCQAFSQLNGGDAVCTPESIDPFTVTVADFAALQAKGLDVEASCDVAGLDKIWVAQRTGLLA
jgi:hypothetical protein